MNRPVSFVSLRTLIMLLVGLLLVVALVFAASALHQSRASLRNATELAERNRLAGRCLQAIRGFAGERDRGSVLLGAPDPANSANRHFVDERRRVSDARIGEVIKGLPDAFVAQGETLGAAWARVQALRTALDRDFSLGRAARDPALPAQWLSAAGDLTASLAALLIDVSDVTGQADASFHRLGNLRVLAMQFDNVLAAEATLLAAELSAGRTPSRAVIGTANQLRGRALQLWSQLEAGTGSLADPDAVAAIGKIRISVVTELWPIEDEIIRAAGSDRRTPVELIQYQSALDASAKLADGISRAADAYARMRLDQAKRQELMSLASIAAILILAALVAILLVRRLTRPLNGILERIDKLRVYSGGYPLTRADAGGDEFARVHHALDSLDEAMRAHLRSEQALGESERISASILACIPQSIIATDVNGLITLFSPGAENMLGYSAEEIIGKQTPMLFHDPAEIRAEAEALSTEQGIVDNGGFDALIARTKTSAMPDAHEWTYIRKNGTRLSVILSTTSLRNAAGEIDGYLGVATDITERTRAAARITRMAHYDQLTQLPNRRLFHDRMQVAIAQARREGSRLALMLIDLDKFKPVNDQHGHAVGDLLLTAVARRMQECLRESDTLARIGGDEFVVILPVIRADEDALGVAEKIRLALNEPFELSGGYRVSIACCIGIAIYPDHGHTEKRLSKKADDAMYTAKELGRNRVRLFSTFAGSRVKNESGARDLSFVRLVWHRSYKCGEASIDREHQELFVRANALIQAAMSDEESPGALPRALDELIDSVARHFANEEVVLARYHYSGREEHAIWHRMLVEQALLLRGRAHAGELTLGEVVTFLAQDVVVKHMLKEDRKFYSLFRTGLNAAPSDSILARRDD